MNKFLLALTLFLASCSNPKKDFEGSIPVNYGDTIILQPNQRNWYFEVDDPSRGKFRIELSNYTDSVMTFVIDAREL